MKRAVDDGEGKGREHHYHRPPRASYSLPQAPAPRAALTKPLGGEERSMAV